MAKEYQIFRESIKQYIDNHKLDIGAKYFVLKDIFHDIEAEYFAQINNEALAESERVKQDAESTQSN